MRVVKGDLWSRTYLDCADGGVGFAYETDYHRALLYRFARIFNLEDSALRRAVGRNELVRLLKRN